MMKYNLYIGLNDKTTKRQEISTVECYKLISNIMIANKVEGYTILQAQGFYIHQDKTITTENSLKVELMFTDIETVQQIIADIKKILNQESVVLERQKIESELV